MSQINLKRQPNSETFTPDANYVGIFYSSDLNTWAYKDENGVTLPMISLSGVSFTFTQNSPLSTWIVNHNLGFNPSVQIFTFGGQKVVADVINITLNQTIINFISPFEGTARFN
jgi:hypothetical protein